MDSVESIDQKNLIFLDESGDNLRMSTDYSTVNKVS